MILKDRVKKLLKVWLEEIEKHSDSETGLDKIPGMKLDQYRTVHTVLSIFRAAVDERAVEEEMSRPRFSLEAVNSDELRVAILAKKKEEEVEEWRLPPT
jgi:hypothetical protein